MAEALVSAALDLLSTSAWQEWTLLTGCEAEIKKAERNLKAIHALLGDAEEKQMSEPSVKLWVTRVKDGAYDLEDILDEWNTAFLKSKVDEAGSSLTPKRKVFSSICDSVGLVSRRHKIADQIKRINDELDEIAKEKDRYQLMKKEIKRPRRVESTSFVDVSKLRGRDEVKKEIVSALLSENSNQIISIVGMGGLGKTALAQLIYNDDEVRQHFSNVIWVCVSDFFDQYKIARAILESLPSLNSPIPTSTQGVLEKICEKTTNTKFFLVLDDVWTERDEDWEPFKAIFRKGMSGSRVLVTTRKESVAVGMESFRMFHLEKLSDEFCWLILSQVAFSGKDKKLCETLEDVGKEIAKKCKGLPLAAKTLGGLLREKRTRDEWQNVLNNELWRLSFAQDIFTPLLLSYYDLPPVIRPCFLYCVIFPKDYVVRKYELIMHWMAQGYLNSDGDVEMESLGEEYFNYLASRSLFQDFNLRRGVGILYCKMHDMVYDFVKVLVKDEISSKVIEAGVLDSISGNVRHLSILQKMNDSPEFGRCSMEKLRSFVSNVLFDVTNEVLQNLFNGAKCLRVLKLCLSELNFQGKHPERKLKEIGKLIHLRYLNFSHSIIQRLPEEVCELHNLQVLDVSLCSNLSKLPDGMEKLINLRHLHTYGCNKLRYYPKGIASLTSLRALDFVIAQASNHPTRFSFGDLANLNFLREPLEVVLVGTTLNMEEVRRAKLHNKIHLKCLWIYLEPYLWAEEDRVRQALNPPPNLSVEFRHISGR